MRKAYDQPVYEDDDEVELPCRYLTNWSCSTGSFPVDVKDTTFKKGTVFTGTLQPRGKADGTDGIVIEIRPLGFTFNDTLENRGYWLTTDHAYYRLFEPEDESKHLAARAVLTCLSNIVNNVFCDELPGYNEKSAKYFANRSIRYMAEEKKYVDLPLAEAVGYSTIELLEDCHPGLRRNCNLFQSLKRMETTATEAAKKDPEWLLARCIKVEKRLPQTPWGRPRELDVKALDEDSSDDEDGKVAAKPSKKRRRSSSTKKASPAKRAKAVPPPQDEVAEEKGWTSMCIIS